MCSALGSQVDLSGFLGVLDGRGEQAGQAAGGERVVAAAFRQQALASAGDEQDAVLMPTSA